MFVNYLPNRNEVLKTLRRKPIPFSLLFLGHTTPLRFLSVFFNMHETGLFFNHRFSKFCVHGQVPPEELFQIREKMIDLTGLIFDQRV